MNLCYWKNVFVKDKFFSPAFCLVFVLSIKGKYKVCQSEDSDKDLGP